MEITDNIYLGNASPEISGGGGSGTVDQTYDAASPNAQSGTAVAEALTTLSIPTVDTLLSASSSNAVSNAAVCSPLGGSITVAGVWSPNATLSKGANYYGLTSSTNVAHNMSDAMDYILSRIGNSDQLVGEIEDIDGYLINGQTSISDSQTVNQNIRALSNVVAPGVGVNATFETADGKQVTVTNGIITAVEVLI